MCAKLDSRIIEHAKKLVEQNRVINAVKYAASKVWFAEVLDGTQLYDVYLDTADSQEDSCQCYEFKQHNYCRHSIAVELYLNVKGHHNIREIHLDETLVPTHEMDQFNKEMRYLLETRERFDEVSISQLVNVNLSCQVVLESRTLHTQDNLSLSLKIGKEKLYTVRQFSQFFNDYRLKSPFTVGSREIIDWHVDMIDRAEHDFIEWLGELVLQGRGIETGKQIGISPEDYHELFRHLVQLNQATILFNQVSFEAKIFQETPPKLLVSITEKQECFEMQLKSQSVYFFEASNMLFVDGVLSIVAPSQVEIYKRVLRLFLQKTKQITEVPREYLSDFINYTLPILMKIAQINEEFLLKVATQRPTVYFDVELSDLLVSIAVEYVYPKLPYVMQDIALEKQIYRCLRQLGFVDNERLLVDRYELYVFLTDGLELLKRLGIVRLPKEWQNLFIETVVEPSVTFHPRGGLLDVSFAMEGISQKDIAKILKMIQENEKFYEFSNGRILSLESEQFDKVHHILSSIRGKYRIKNGTVQLKKAQILQVADKLGEDNVKDTFLKQMIEDLTHPENFEVSVPKTLKATLKPYQEYGFRWLKMLSHYQLGGILADDMGLGKTIQSIAYVLSEYELNRMIDKKALIIAPASLLFNWQHEFNKFAPHLNIHVVVGTKQERTDSLENTQIDVFITSYQSFRQDMSSYYEKEWHVVILDESQVLKNATTKIHHSLRDLNAYFMFALSGTPIENRKEDFWSIYALILPGLFPSIKEYRQLTEQTISKIARPFLLRRLKKDVLTELPDKVETTMYSELTDNQKLLYVSYLQRMQERLKEYSAQDMLHHRFDILMGITRLRQICCHPALFVENYEGDSGKLEQFLTLVETALSNGRRILVFSHFAKMLNILENALHVKGYSTLKMTGKTPVKDRLKMVDDFNGGKSDIFLLSLKVGGAGLNLASADTIILYDLWWNPAVEEQATSRAHRMGQKNSVQVYRMVSQGTIEEKMLQLQQQKKELFEVLVTTETNGLFKRQNLTIEDIQEILGLL